MSKGIAAVFVLHVAATLAMTGLIWFVQIMHYPLFLKIPPSSFPIDEAAHTVRTGWIVAPWMLLELGSGLFLSWASLSTDGASFWANAASPAARRFDFCKIRSLVPGNRVRTIRWTARSVILLWILWDRFPARRI